MNDLYEIEDGDWRAEPKWGQALVVMAVWVALGLLAVSCAGCEPEKDPTAGESTPILAGSRITATKIGTMMDSGYRRTVGIFTDTKTGREYLGVTGMGIIELKGN